MIIVWCRLFLYACVLFFFGGSVCVCVCVWAAAMGLRLLCCSCWRWAILSYVYFGIFFLSSSSLSLSFQAISLRTLYNTYKLRIHTVTWIHVVDSLLRCCCVVLSSILHKVDFIAFQPLRSHLSLSHSFFTISEKQRERARERDRMRERVNKGEETPFLIAQAISFYRTISAIIQWERYSESRDDFTRKLQMETNYYRRWRHISTLSPLLNTLFFLHVLWTSFNAKRYKYNWIIGFYTDDGWWYFY